MLAPWKKSYDQPRQHIKNKRHYFSIKVCIVKAMLFAIVTWMWVLDHKEVWVPKNRCFWTVVLDSNNLRVVIIKLLLRVPWTARRSNQSIRKEINAEYSWKDWCRNWNSNTLATWCEEPTHWKRLWFQEGLKAGREGDDRGWDGWVISPTQWTWVWASSGRWWRTGKPSML